MFRGTACPQPHRLAHPISLRCTRDESWLSLGKRPPETGIRTCFPDRISQLGKSEKHTESILKFSRVDWKLLNKIFRRRCILIIFPGQTRSRFFSLLSSTLFEHCQMYSALIPAKDGDVTKAQMMCMFVCVSAIERWSKISRIWRIM